MSSQPAPVKRPRGAPRGNQNARKHGFYSQVLDKDQRRYLQEAALVTGIDEEISLLRLKLRTVLDRDPENIRLIAQASSALARLVRTRHRIGADRHDNLGHAVRSIIKDAVDAGWLTVDQVKQQFSL